MKLKQLAKRVIAVGFASFMAAVCLAEGSSVYAGVNDYPPEVKFPISVLDFRRDDLLFEYQSSHSYFDLCSGKYSGGKGLVENVLDEEGYPVYKKDVIEEIAKYVKKACESPAGTTLNNLKTDGDNLSPLCVRNFIKKEYRRDVLTLEYARRYMDCKGVEIPEEYIKWKIDDGGAHDYVIKFDDRYGQHGKFPVVFETTGGTEVALYSIEYNGIVMIADGVKVSYTLTGLTTGKQHKIQYSKTDNMNVYVNGVAAASGSQHQPDGAGKMKISIERNGSPNPATVAGATAENYVVEAEDCIVTDNAVVATGAGFSGTGINTNVRWDGAGTLNSQFECSTAGDYVMSIYYACGVEGQYALSVNGGETQVVNCAASGDPYVLAPVPAEVTVSLKEGTNTIVFSDVGGSAPTLDRFEIKKGGAQIGSALVNDNGWYNFEAEDCLTSGIKKDSLFCSGSRYAGGIDTTSKGKCTVNLHSDVDGIRRLRLYYCSNSARKYKVVVNGISSAPVNCPGTGSWNNPCRTPVETNINLIKGDNTIEISYIDGAYAPNLDRFEIESELSGSKVEDLTLTSSENGYPLGNYEQSKEKYLNNPELGWFDMTTCMDYAYFVTRYFWRSHPSLNTPYTNYDTLIFNRTKYEGNWAYVFAADSKHKDAKYRLVMDKNTRTIHNDLTKQYEHKSQRDSAPSNLEFGDPGYMFICEQAPHVTYDGKDYDAKLNSDAGVKKNFHYSIRSHSQFVFNSAIRQYFDFSGDDDVYVFVNNHLVLDLGGAHSQLSYKIDLLNLYQQQEANPSIDYGLKDGEVVNFDMYYLERHSTGSNFYALMNIMLAPDQVTDNIIYKELPYGYNIDLNYQFTTQRQMTTNKNFRFSDDFGNQVGSQGLVLGPGVKLKNNKLIAKVKKLKNAMLDPQKPENYEEDASRSKEFTFADPNNPTPAELTALQTYFENLSLYLNESVTLEGLQYDTGYKRYTQYDAANPADPEKRSIVFKTYVNYDSWMDGASEKTDNDTKKTTPVDLLVHSIMVKTDTKDNQKKQLASYGQFTVTREGDPAKMYTNDPQKTKKKSEVAMKYVAEGVEEYLPEGIYTLKLDETVLHNYDVYIYQGPDYDVTPDDVPAAKLDPANQMKIEFKASYNPTTKHWEFWDYYFVLRAKRDLLDLKDLT